tara:strand:+ start:5091 stop:5267 length:177 start_codon:yes stop_codon:yes gene_type:complete
MEGQTKKQGFILSVLEKVFKFLSKMRCVMCNSTCVVNKECPEKEIEREEELVEQQELH